MTALSTIGQIHVSVRDIDASVAFYRDLLGLPLLFRVPGQPMAFFDCDGIRLYLGEPEPEFRSHPLLYFHVDGIEEAHHDLSERGVAFIDQPHVVHREGATELWMAFFRDPDGTVLALMEERAAAA
ncbi:MAG: VOC family protein [Egibacteraceae bacterium]